MEVVFALSLVVLVIGNILIYQKGVRGEMKKGYSPEEARRRIKKMLK